MTRPLAQRYAPQFGRTVHMASVRLNDELIAFLKNKKPLSLADMQRLCSLMESLLAIQKLLPQRPTKTAGKPLKAISFEELTRDQET